MQRVRPDGARWTLFGLAVLAFIIVPYLLFSSPLEQWTTGLIESSRQSPEISAAIVVALLAADAVLPIPSSLLSVLAGYTFGWRDAAVLIWIGMTLGALLGYALGAGAGRGVALGILGETELARARRLAHDVGPVALVVTRAVPVIGEAAAIVAGAARMPLWLFTVSTAAANVVVAIAYGVVGAGAAHSAQWFLIVFLGLVTIPALGWTAWRMLLKRGDSDA